MEAFVMKMRRAYPRIRRFVPGILSGVLEGVRRRPTRTREIAPIASVPEKRQLRTIGRFRVPLCGLAAAILLSMGPVPASAQTGVVPLYTWYSEERGDFYTTSSPEWRGEIGTIRPGQGNYRLMRVEGYVFDPERARPPGTVPLYHWWSEFRQDNFLTSNPDWSGRVGDVRPGQGDYRLFRIEGYLFDRPYANTVPLYSLWSSTHADNRATADPTMWGSVRVSLTTPEGPYVRYRLEGQILRLAGGEEPPADEDALRRKFGLGRLAPTVARIPVLILLHEWRDVSFPKGAVEDYRNAFTPTAPATEIGLEHYSSFLSGGTFHFPVDDIVGPFRDTITLAQASTLSSTKLRQLAINLLDRNGVDLSRFDRNPVDGTVGPNELIIARFIPGGGSGGQHGLASASADGITVNTSVLLLAERSGHSGVMHELLHRFGTEHVYGPNYVLNYQATLMAGHLPAGDYATQQLDPYSRLQLGWAEPLLHNLTGEAAQQVFSLKNMDGRPSRVGVILFHPSHPQEYFILQARDLVHPADRVAPGPGLMVWHVLTNGDNSLQTIWRWRDTANRISWPLGEDTTQQVEGALSLGADGRLGVPALFTPTSPAFELRWFDGSTTGAEIRVLTATAAGVDVALQRRGALALPRIDTATPLVRSATATLTGIMPPTDRDTWVVRLRRIVATPGGLPTVEQVALPVEGWAHFGVTVRVPAATATGRWEVRLEGPSSGLSSNALAVDVR
jgi:hypothetical protein